MAIAQKLKNLNASEIQIEVVERMLAAPAGGWVAKKVVGASFLGVRCDGVAVQLVSKSLNLWGVVLPSGEFVKPKPGCKTIYARDIAYKM